jgi:hypothetical protein
MIDFGTWRPWDGGGTSQGKTFLRCASRWWFENVAGLEGDESDAMRRGSRLHAAWERYLLTGELAKEGEIFVTQHNDDAPVTHPPMTADEVEMFLSTLHRLPTPPMPLECVEARFRDHETYAPVKVRSTIDLYSPDWHYLDDGRRALLVVDHKSTSGPKWMKTGLEIPNDFQACVFVVEARRAIGWKGPIVFRLIYATTRRPFISEVREYCFEPHEIDAAETFVRETLHAMYLTAMSKTVDAVPFNTTACDDYKSKARPDGCPHRMRCASIGRPVDTGFAAMLFLGVPTMTAQADPLADLLAAGQAPPADPLNQLLAAGKTAPAAPVDAARAANLARFAELRPNTTVADDQLVQALQVAETEQTRLIVEITSLMPALANDEARAMLRSRSISRLTEQRDSIQRPKDPSAMTRDEVEAELVGLNPAFAGHFDGKPTEGLVALLIKLRAQAATANHGINSPENLAPTAPVDTKTAAEATKPAPAKTTSTRGLRMPAEYGGELVGSTTKKSGAMQRFLTDNGVQVPAGAGATKVMRDLCKQLLTGTHPNTATDDAPPPATTATPPPASAPTDPKEAARLQCLDEIRKLSNELGITPSASLDEWPVDLIVPELTRLRTLSLEMAAPTTATATVEAAPPPSASSERPGPFVLFVDCRPSAMPAADLTTLAADVFAAVAKAAGVSHYLAMDYNNCAKKAAAVLATQIVSGALQLPQHVYVSTATPDGAIFVEALAPLAAEVIRGDR